MSALRENVEVEFAGVVEMHQMDVGYNNKVVKKIARKNIQKLCHDKFNVTSFLELLNLLLLVLFCFFLPKTSMK